MPSWKFNVHLTFGHLFWGVRGLRIKGLFYIQLPCLKNFCFGWLIPNCAQWKIFIFPAEFSSNVVSFSGICSPSPPYFPSRAPLLLPVVAAYRSPSLFSPMFSLWNLGAEIRNFELMLEVPCWKPSFINFFVDLRFFEQIP